MNLKERVQAHGQKVLAVVQEIRKQTAERDKLLAVLEMQAMVMAQGIDVNDVQSYGYDPNQDKRKVPNNQRLIYLGRHGEARWRSVNPVYNFVTLKDGARLDIEPVPIPRN